MNKTVIRIILALIAAALLLFFLLRNNSPFGKDNSSFAIDPDNEITRMEFSDGSRNLSLKKDGSGWLINGETEARKSGIQFILRILREIKIKSPVSTQLFETEVSAKSIVPVKVKIYKNRKLIKNLLVYKTRSNVYGNIMKMNEGSKPFIVYIPGYEGEIGSAFTTNELFWQSYTVFNLMPSEISLVKFENLSDTASSFSIFRKDRHFILSGNTGSLTGWDSALVTRYLSYFTRIPFESWNLEMEENERRLVEQQQPLYRLSVITTSGQKTDLTLWERLKVENGNKTKDTDRLFGKTQNSNEFFIMKYFDIDPLLKKRSYFFH